MNLPDHTIEKMYALGFVRADFGMPWTVIDGDNIVHPLKTEDELRALLCGVYLGRNQVARVVLHAMISDDARGQLAEGLRGRFGKGIE